MGGGGPGAWGWRAHGGMGGGCHAGRGMGGGHGGRGAEHPKLGARFVRDVTIFDGTQMAPGTNFTKIWRLKNVGEVPWPPGARMLFVGGDQMTSEMSVPLSRAAPVMPGEEVDVAVELTAPMELGRYIGHWRLTGPHMRRKFGQRFCCHVQVVDPSAKGDEAFDDLPKVLAEIEKKKGELGAAEGSKFDKNDEDEDTADGDEATKAEAATMEAAALSAPVDVSDNHEVAKVAPKEEVKEEANEEVKEEVKEVKEGKEGKEEGKDQGKDNEDDLYTSDDGVLVSDAMLENETVTLQAEGKATITPPFAIESTAGMSSAGAHEALAAMGFTDATLVELVVAMHGGDVEACARDLAAASEWAHLLDDLDEMGFKDAELNKSLMLKNAGNMKRTVRDLVEGGP